MADSNFSAYEKAGNVSCHAHADFKEELLKFRKQNKSFSSEYGGSNNRGN